MISFLGNSNSRRILLMFSIVCYAALPLIEASSTTTTIKNTWTLTMKMANEHCTELIPHSFDI